MYIANAIKTIKINKLIFGCANDNINNDIEYTPANINPNIVNMKYNTTLNTVLFFIAFTVLSTSMP